MPIDRTMAPGTWRAHTCLNCAEWGQTNSNPALGLCDCVEGKHNTCETCPRFTMAAADECWRRLDVLHDAIAANQEKQGE